ncbi:hypothetical protein [Staphylococcus pasteuri]|uniref:DUF7366 family protein n=1 Tax=Staphylococcus pasteuri TaxID=45972 RepID=UPI001E3DABD7|nr:hypothetical protein [Staphylococcus pasteuri]MCE3022558.1 hypothetical protein [Staphylococcus pasteuri]
MISMFKDFVKNKKAVKQPKIKLSGELTDNIRDFKNKSPEEKEEFLNKMMEDLKEQSFYKNNPMLNSMSDEQLKNFVKMTYNIIDTGDDSDD